jgi:cation diffusion facilitator family transporter
LLAILRDSIPFLHGHSHSELPVDDALESSARGLWALKVSLLILGATAIFQVVIAVISGSVGLLADTIHNFSDALTAVPLAIAFVLGRRPPNRRYTYGYGRAEDLAGLTIVGMIFISAVVAAYETYDKFVHPAPLAHVGWVMVAGVLGFLGNEAVAVLRIRVGRQIGSAALVADGKHAQADGVTSLAVLFGAGGSILGWAWADPLVGALITLAILFILKDTAVTMWHRVMDAVEPELVARVEREAVAVAGVHEVQNVRMRWIGHRLNADLHITVDEELTTLASHAIAEEVQHNLMHAEPKLATIMVHVDPCGHGGTDAHHLTDHHRAAPA